jgi:hypothetical protein
MGTNRDFPNLLFRMVRIPVVRSTSPTCKRIASRDAIQTRREDQGRNSRLSGAGHVPTPALRVAALRFPGHCISMDEGVDTSCGVPQVVELLSERRRSLHIWPIREPWRNVTSTALFSLLGPVESHTCRDIWTFCFLRKRNEGRQCRTFVHHFESQAAPKAEITRQLVSEASHRAPPGQCRARGRRAPRSTFA